MSFYNMINGFNISCILFLPMLGRKAEDYPRFRDCFLDEDHDHIVIYTRTGGGNRGCGYGEEDLYKDENYVDTWDDEYDPTYGYYRFNIPKKWRKDFDKIINADYTSVSAEYVNCVREFYPLLNENGLIDKIFRNKEENDAN